MKKNNKVFFIEYRRMDGGWEFRAVYDNLLKFIADIDKELKRRRLIPMGMKSQDYIDLSVIDGVNYIYINRLMNLYRYKLVKLNKL